MKISEIAELAGVSIATVSRAINNKGKVSPEVQKRVLDIVAKYDYVPNATGRSLRTSKTGVFLITIPDLSNPFYSRLIDGAQYQAAELGYNLILAPIQAPREYPATAFSGNEQIISPDAEEKYISMLSMKQVDGIIALGTALPEDEIHMLNQNYPFVFACECPLLSFPVSCVEIDNRKAAFDAVNKLYQLGHRKIAMISFHYICTSAIRREEGYKTAMEANSLPCPEEYIIRTDYSYEGGYASCRKLLRLPSPPTALFCYNDKIAIGAVRYLAEHGLRAGKDMDVIGFDDTEITGEYLPSISSVAHPSFDIGSTAVNLLMEKIKNLDSTPKKVILPHRIILRDTTHQQIMAH